MVKLIIDVDTGVDDAWALLTFLTSKEFEILGVTCTHGNTSVDNVCRNTLYILTLAGRCEIPVFKGAQNPLINYEQVLNLRQDCKSYYGQNGFGDVSIPTLSLPQIREESAFEALNRLAEEHKGEIRLVCLGPLTNIAITSRTYPQFSENIKDVYIMGGNYIGIGNTTMCAEFNFHSDPEAAHIVLSCLENKLILLPWETCLRLKIPYDWRLKVLGQHSGKNRIIDLMNKVEEPILARGRRKGYSTWISCDSFLAALVVDPDTIVEKEFKSHAVIELSGKNTRGQIVIDHLKTKDHNITIIEGLNREKIQERLLVIRDFYTTSIAV